MRIARVGAKVHEGLCFWFRSAASAAAGQQQWYNSLGRLSGGERTLVCLALILAVSPTFLPGLFFPDVVHDHGFLNTAVQMFMIIFAQLLRLQ